MGVTIALLGDRQPDHPSHRELDAVRGMLGDDVVAEWVATDSEAAADLAGLDGIWLVPGSPYSDEGAAYAAVRWARENDVPFLGTCGGLQYAVVEFFRNVLGVASASHAEADGTGETNVVHALACGLQGEERLVRPIAGTRFARLVGGEPFVGMHYCSYGPGPDEVRRLVQAGMVVEATADDAGAEVIELPINRFYVLTLFQPHIGALAGKPIHPLLREFVRCARVGVRGAAVGAEGATVGAGGATVGAGGTTVGAGGTTAGAERPGVLARRG